MQSTSLRLPLRYNFKDSFDIHFVLHDIIITLSTYLFYLLCTHISWTIY